MKEFEKLLLEAQKILGNTVLREWIFRYGSVASALQTGDGNIYSWVCLIGACGIGFCAEHSAIAEMLKNKESHITHILALHEDEKILPPCGRCRELILQLWDQNLETKVLLPDGKIQKLKDLYGEFWVTYH